MSIYLFVCLFILINFSLIKDYIHKFPYTLYSYSQIYKSVYLWISSLIYGYIHIPISPLWVKGKMPFKEVWKSLTNFCTIGKADHSQTALPLPEFYGRFASISPFILQFLGGCYLNWRFLKEMEQPHFSLASVRLSKHHQSLLGTLRNLPKLISSKNPTFPI